jgi:hypothetical protein
VIDYTGPSPLDAVRQQIRSAYANGSWAGNGIAASLANATNFGLGYGEAGAIFASFPATFSGQGVDNTSVLVAFTRYGDANLDGLVNLSDFNRLASNFGTPSGAVWTQGDFNYDGIINLTDFNRLAANFGLSATGPEVTPQDWTNLASVVPEPAMAVGGCAAVMLITLRGSRRRRRRR